MNRLGAVAVAVGCWFYTVADAAVDVPPSTVLARSVFSYQTYGGGDGVFHLTARRPLSLANRQPSRT